MFPFSSVPSTRYIRLYSIHGTITDKSSAQDFIYSLSTKERKHLYEELALYHGDDSSKLPSYRFSFSIKFELEFIVIYSECSLIRHPINQYFDNHPIGFKG